MDNDQIKYKESVIINIISKIEAVSKVSIIKMLLDEGIDLPINKLDLLLQHLIDKRYIYQHNDKENHSRFDLLYSNSDYYFKHVCNKLDNLILRTSTKPLKLYDNVNVFPQLYLITIKTKAKLNEDSFKNIDIKEFKVSKDNHNSYTYTLIGFIKYNNSLIIEPNLEYIKEITNNIISDNHFYYSLRISVKEFIVYKFNTTETNKYVKTEVKRLYSFCSDYLYCVYFSKDNCDDYEFIDRTSSHMSHFNSTLEVNYSKEKGELLFLIHPLSNVTIKEHGSISINC